MPGSATIVPPWTRGDFRGVLVDRNLNVAHSATESDCRRHSMRTTTSTTERTVNSQPIAVEIKNLVKRFGDFVAVDNVSLTVQPWGDLWFPGLQRCWKDHHHPHVVRAAHAYQLAAPAWEALTSPLRLSRSSRPSDTCLKSFLSTTISALSENIDFFSGVYSVPQTLRRERKEYVLKMSGLENRSDTMTRLLPAGWKQRLALGCAILHQPPILFLDEPTSGVDPIARRSFWDLIYQLSAEGHTVFVTTHYMDEAEYCHRLALMHRGRLIGLGPAAELKAAMVSHTLMHLESTDVLESLRALEHSEEVIEAAVFGSGLHLTVRDAAAAESAVRSCTLGTRHRNQAAGGH